MVFFSLARQQPYPAAALKVLETQVLAFSLKLRVDSSRNDLIIVEEGQASAIGIGFPGSYHAQRTDSSTDKLHILEAPPSVCRNC